MKSREAYQELYKKEKEKLAVLFKEMLDFAHCEYDEAKDAFSDLETLVMQEYPFYMDVLIHLDVKLFDPEETYPSILDTMEAIYKKFSKNYKNREALLKEYEEAKDTEWDIGP